MSESKRKLLEPLGMRRGSTTTGCSDSVLPVVVAWVFLQATSLRRHFQERQRKKRRNFRFGCRLGQPHHLPMEMLWTSSSKLLLHQELQLWEPARWGNLGAGMWGTAPTEWLLPSLLGVHHFSSSSRWARISWEGKTDVRVSVAAQKLQ